MNGFVQDALNILDVAENASRAGHTPANLSILIGRDGNLHLVDNSSWSLSALRAEHGARAAYRVEARGGRIQVEGAADNRRCRLQVESPSRAARLLLPRRIALPAQPTPPRLLSYNQDDAYALPCS